MPIDPTRPLPSPLLPLGDVQVAMTIRTRGLDLLAFELRRLAARADGRAVAATHRSWMIKGQAAADRCRDRISEHESLAEAATAVANALERHLRGPGSGSGRSDPS